MQNKYKTCEIANYLYKTFGGILEQSMGTRYQVRKKKEEEERLFIFSTQHTTVKVTS
jgi:hypothetical protein